MYGEDVFEKLHERVNEKAFLAFLRGLQRESTGTLKAMIEVLKETTDAETAAWFDEKFSS